MKNKNIDLMELTEEDYYNKVYGCWLGKNCGGTLGAPLESGWGKEEMFDVWWYPELKEGGIPNDDLELQLIWLQALEDRGIHIKARDLAEYWLDCVQYNFDEYGLHKTNLKKGLLPPISGYYNNYFKHCMGSPIRSEIWACIAPGLPNIAASYAYEDAIVDHAGGESVYGEMFNAALESAAFLLSDKGKLLEIALSFIPQECETARAIRNAIKAYREGMSWKEARNFVLRSSYSPIAQYSPPNLGFQTIGLLYGKDFGDAICKAVNCGYDTDCTGATLGALLGIILGKGGLPEKWIKPLSDKIITNSSWRGITNVKEPKNLDELTKRICRIGRKILSFYGERSFSFGSVEREKRSAVPSISFLSKSLRANEDIKRLWHASPTKIDFDLHTVLISVDYLNDPVIKAGVAKDFQVTLKNLRLTKLELEASVKAPEGWRIEPHLVRKALKPGEELLYKFTVKVDDIKALDISNRASLYVSIKARPQMEEVPLVFLAAKRWLISNVFEGEEESSLEDDPDPCGLNENWSIVDFSDNELKIEENFRDKSGAIYLRHYVWSPDERDVRVGLPSNCPFKMYLNGKLIHQVMGEGSLRPNYAGDGRSYVDARLRKGWNQFFIKVVRKKGPVQAHFVIAGPSPFYHGFSDLVEHKLPWEA